MHLPNDFASDTFLSQATKNKLAQAHFYTYDQLTTMTVEELMNKAPTLAVRNVAYLTENLKKRSLSFVNSDFISPGDMKDRTVHLLWGKGIKNYATLAGMNRYQIRRLFGEYKMREIAMAMSERELCPSTYHPLRALGLSDRAIDILMELEIGSLNALASSLSERKFYAEKPIMRELRYFLWKHRSEITTPISPHLLPV